MASSPPPFMAEDTDEDFFDKLVNDDDDDYSYKPSTISINAEKNSSGSIVNDNDLDDAKAFANLSITDTGTWLEDQGKLVIGEVEVEEINSDLPTSFAFDSGNEKHDNGPSIQLDSTTESEATAGIKQVQWSAFGSDSLDFFDEFGDAFVGKDDDNIVTSVVNDSLQVPNVNNYSHQFLGKQENVNEYSQSQTTNGELQTDAQDPNSWENLYPGWRYDTNTAQWYHVDETNNATSNAQQEYTASDWTASNEKSEVSYLQQSVAFTESITNLNQVSQDNNINNNKVYPSHMVFDPQYPDWYYDMNIQEWSSLDDYNSQSSYVAQEQVNQNGIVANYGNDQKTYGVQEQDNNWDGSFSNAEQHISTMWQLNNVANSEPMAESRNYQQVGNHFGKSFHVDHRVNQHQSYDIGSVNKATEVNKEFPSVAGPQSFVPFSQPFTQSSEHSETTNIPKAYGNQNQFSYMKQPVQSGYQISYGSAAGKSSDGRPPHALVTFGFGGKLIVMKDCTSLVNASYGGQDSSTGSISVLNLAEVVISGAPVHDYFHTLCQQPFPGPLSGGNAGAKELNRIIDERITHSETSGADFNKVEVLRLLLSLLKIASQHYGKFRSPFGSDTTLKENDAPEVAVARLFSSVKSRAENKNYGAFANCLQQVPSEGQTRETAAEVQTLLVSGRKKDALLRAQEGQLWGPALVLAAQLGDQFYVDTVRKMALGQLVPGSPLRTLCLLIAGQPADVFAADATTDVGIPGAVDMSHQPTQAQHSVNGMLDGWEDNLAVITANRTKDDELVLIHLGDCLWKERSNIIAAHICYLVAEANFEPYSDSARLCLIGADHWKHPRTYASPEAIQRTELYEYSKMLGNSQFTLLPFQPYKLIYAHMLAEVGRVSDSLKYCQAVTKSLKTGRIPEVETWRQLVISLEDRIKAHQLGGFSTNLAPGKIYGKLLNLLDSTAHRVVGGLPPPVPSASGGTTTQNDHHHQPPKAARVLSSQSTMTMSSLMPSASMEPINQVDVNNARMMHNRSASEPDFGRSPRQNQDDTLKENSADSQSKASGKTSRLGRFGFGSGLFQKTVGMVLKPRQGNQAKLGDTNKFYYNEKLKRWVEEGVDPPVEEAALPPPPTMAAFQNGSPDYSLKTALRSESMSSGSSEFLSPTPASHIPGIPPIPAATNQFSARGRTGVRARYVDTFNQGGVNPTNLFQSPSIPTKLSPNPQFFVPTAEPERQPVNSTPTPDNLQQNTTTSSGSQTPSFSSSLSIGMQKFASMDDMSKGGTSSTSTSTSTSSFSEHPMSRRTVSWSGNANQNFSHSGNNGEKPFGSMGQYTFASNETGFTHPSNDDLQEVEL